MRKDNYVRIRCGTDMGSIARKDDGFDGTGLDGIEKLWSAVVDVEACCVGAWLRVQEEADGEGDGAEC